MDQRRDPALLDVNPENVEERGFFLKYMGKRKTQAYQRKLRWLQARFAEGMRIKMVQMPREPGCMV